MRRDFPLLIGTIITGFFAIWAGLALLSTAEMDGLLKLILLGVGVLLAVGVYFRPKLTLPFLLVFSILVIIGINLEAIYNWLDGALRFIFDPQSRIDPRTVIVCSESQGCSTLWPIVWGVVFVLLIVTGFAYTTLLERRFVAWIQARVGPNRVGPQGVFQPVADAIKLIFKEDIRPAQATPVYFLAPMLKAIPVLIVVAVIPLGPDILIPWFDGNWYQVPLGIADVNVGVLWILAVTSIATYGVVLAGWSSNNKYALLGGLRASAQMISYELTLGLAIAVPVMIAGSMSIGDIINQQQNIWEWYVFQNPLAAALLMIALLAEVNRSPFDLPEAEQELTQGYMTEYSGMKFAMFMMAEYIGMIAVSMIAIALFFGGYHLIPMGDLAIAAPLNFILKLVLFLAGIVWVRGTLPRLRYDRLMMFGWKVMLPLGLLAVAWTAISIVVGEELTSSLAYGVVSGIFFVVTLIVGYFLLRDTAEDTEEYDLATDPMVTGENLGIRHALLMVLGGIIAIPFAIVEWNIKLFDGMRNLGQSPSDETAITEAPSSTPATKSGGD